MSRRTSLGMPGIIVSQVLFVLPILIIAGLFTSCEMPGGDSLVQKYEGTDPAAALDDLTLKAILANELAGADYKSTAANILAWQDATMKYAVQALRPTLHTLCAGIISCPEFSPFQIWSKKESMLSTE